MFFTHLECASGCGAGPFDPRERHFLCPSCALPLLARYDLARGARVAARVARRPRADHVAVSRAAAAAARRRAGHARRGLHAAASRHAARRVARPRAPVHQGRVAQPDQLVQGARPVGRDHARQGARRAHDRAADRRQRRQRRRRLRRGRRARAARCSCRRTPSSRSSTSAACTAPTVTLVDGLITDAGRMAAETGKPLGWYDVSTLKEPYRVEGKKTMGYELAEQLGWTLPDWIVYPTGGGTGLVGMWKAFDELEAIGWIGPGQRPRMVSVQADGLRADRARVRAGHREGGAVGERAHRRRRPARAARDRRLPDPARHPRERRHGARRVRRARWSTTCSRSAASKASRPRPKAAPR